MANAREAHTATLLPSGKVLVTGGLNGYTALASVELYDPVTNSWSTMASMSVPRENHTATLLPNGDVVVIGGDDGTNPLASSRVVQPAREKCRHSDLGEFDPGI